MHLTILKRTEGALLKAERPYEDYHISYCNVLRTDERWHLWYGAYDHNCRSDSDGRLCHARSEDGIRWERPDLDFSEYPGVKSNNILFGGPAEGGAHGHTVFLDPDAPSGERFKIVFTRMVDGDWWVFGGVSEDGLVWNILEEPLLKKNSDTQTVCFRDGDLYRLYVRMYRGPDFAGIRTVGYSESASFETFPDPVPILEPDDKDPSNLHFYNNAATKLDENLYIMFPSAFLRGEDTVFPHVAFSSDGRHFIREGRAPVMTGGRGFDSMGVYVAPGTIPGPEPGTWWFYYCGTDVGHDATNPKTAKYTGGIGRFLARIEHDVLR